MVLAHAARSLGCASESPFTGLPLSKLSQFADEGRLTAEQLTELRDLSTVSFDDILASVSGPDPDALITMIWSGLDARERDILQHRILAEEPETLRSVADRVGLSAERVRQIERELREGMARECLPGGIFGHLIADVITDCTPVNRVSVLFERHPSLSKVIEPLGVTAWRLLTVACARIEVEDEFVASPTIGSAKQMTAWGIRQFEIAPGVTRADRLHPFLTRHLPQMVEQWLRFCGFATHGQHVIDLSGTVAELMERLLYAAGQPRSREDLTADIESLGLDRSSGTITATLSRDDRFTRLGKGLWGLTAWGQDPYESIQSLIGELVGRGEEVDLDKLYEYGAKRRVSASSIRRTAESAPFEIVSGRVRLRGSSSWTPPLTYRFEDALVVPLVVTTSHLLGLPILLSAGLAHPLGLTFGEARVLPGGIVLRPMTTQLTLEGAGPLFSGRFDVGDRVLIRFSDAGGIDIVRAAPALPVAPDGPARALQLIGLPDCAPSARLARLAEAAGLPADAGASEIAEVFRRKGEHEVARQIVL